MGWQNGPVFPKALIMGGLRSDISRFEGMENEILQLHAAIDHEGLWQSVQLLLHKAFSFQRITLFLGHLGLAEARVVFTNPPIEESDSWYRERARKNPFSPFIEKNIGRSHYHFHEVVGPAKSFRKTEFYKRFASKEGWDKGISVMFWNGDEMRAMFSLYRSTGEKDFSENDREVLLGISRHVEIAIIRVQKINREENFRGALQAFSRTIPAPIILLDWSLNPVFTNLAAYESAAIWNLGREKAASINPRDCFRIPSPVIKAITELKTQFSDPRGNVEERKLPGPLLLHHPRQPQLRVRISPTQYAPAAIARPGFFVVFEEPLNYVEATNPENSSRFRERALQALTPAERKVVAEVCLGKRNEEIAKALNKSSLTVKTQLNSIFQKLEVRSRAELIARMR